MAGREVVGAVEHQIHIPRQCRQAHVVQALDAGFHQDVRIQRRQGIPTRLGLGASEAAHVVQNLPLQIAEFDHIVIRQDDVPYPRRSEIQRHGRPQAPGPDDQDAGGQKAFLPLDSQLIQQDVPGIAHQPRIVE